MAEIHPSHERLKHVAKGSKELLERLASNVSYNERFNDLHLFKSWHESPFLQEKHTQEMIDFVMKHKPDWLNFGAREVSHCARLTENGRTNAETSFGKDAIARLHEEQDEKEFPTGLRVIRGEGDPTAWWWTLAPYLHERFTKQGLSPRESIAVLFEWANATKLGRGAYEIVNGLLPGLHESLEPVCLEPPDWKYRKIGHEFAKTFAEKFGDDILREFRKHEKKNGK